MRSLALSFTIVCLITTTVAGQEAATKQKESHIILDEIVVTASRRETLLSDTPDFIQVISRENIEETSPSSTGEIIEYATGVAVETGTGGGLF